MLSSRIQGGTSQLSYSCENSWPNNFGSLINITPSHRIFAQLYQYYVFKLECLRCITNSSFVSLKKLIWSNHSHSIKDYSSFAVKNQIQNQTNFSEESNELNGNKETIRAIAVRRVFV